MANGKVREYIGARYIPIFADPVEWDIDSTYDTLTMVQHEGETFMTRQYVPAGIQLPNTSEDEESNDYWVHMSNWNAQVEFYRQEVLAFDGRISTLEGEIPSSDFDSTNTVKKAIDDLSDILPGSDFDSTNTVKKAIDDLSDVLPGSDFDSTNTVKKAIDDTANLLPSSAFDSVNTVDARFDVIESNNWVDTNRIANGAITKDKLSSALQALAITVYNVKDYGAIGDGVTDDTQAFQDTIDAAAANNERGTAIYIPINAGEQYKITDTLVITNPYTTVYSDAAYNLSWGSSGVLFSPSSMNAILFEVKASGCRFENLRIETDREYNDYRGIGIKAKLPSIPDTDIIVNDCSFIHFEIAIQHYDRGMKVVDCLFAECTTAIKLLTDNLTNNPNNTMRGIIVSRNRFHQLTYCIYVDNSEPHGIVITDNTIDSPPSLSARSLTLIYADSTSTINGGVISNNTILDAHDFCIDIEKEADCLVISNNSFYNRRGGSITGFIKCAYLNGCNISGNSFNATKRNCIEIGQLVNSIILGNRFAYIAIESTATTHYSAITISTSITMSLICSNIIALYSSVNSRCVEYKGSSAITNLRVMDNMSGRTEIFTNVNSATTTDCKIQANNVS